MNARPHRAAVRAEHADLDIVARADVGGEQERPAHEVHVVARWAIEAERQRLGPARLGADQFDGEAPVDVRRVEQRAVGPVVDEQDVVAALLDADEDRRVLGRERTAGFAPQLGRIADRQVLEGAVDDGEIALERRGLHAGIDRGEAAADVDHVDGNARFNDRGADQRHRVAVRLRAHRLAADVEGDAERVGRLARGMEHRRGLVDPDAELGGEAELGVRRRHAEADAQRQIAGSNAIGRRRRDDLVDLVDRIEAEGADAVDVVRLGDRLGRLDRVHEAQGRVRQQGADEADLGDRGDVIRADAAVPQGADQVGRRVRLDRIHRRPRKLLDEETGGALRGVRADEGNGLRRTTVAGYPQRVAGLMQFKGPPESVRYKRVAPKLPCGGSPMGQRRRI